MAREMPTLMPSRLQLPDLAYSVLRCQSFAMMNALSNPLDRHSWTLAAFSSTLTRRL